jgi:hypothetical protein
VIRWQPLGPRHLTPRAPRQCWPSAAWVASARLALGRQPANTAWAASATLAQPLRNISRIQKRRQMGSARLALGRQPANTAWAASATLAQPLRNISRIQKRRQMGDSNPRPRGREEDELPLSFKSSCVYLQKFVYIYIKNLLVRVAFYI